jgi:hypothetical protein
VGRNPDEVVEFVESRHIRDAQSPPMMLMRRMPVNSALSAEESVESIPGQAGLLSVRLRLCTQTTHLRGFGCRYPQRASVSSDRSNLGSIGFGVVGPTRASVGSNGGSRSRRIKSRLGSRLKSEDSEWFFAKKRRYYGLTEKTG